MKKRTRKLQFNSKDKALIYQRDRGQCLFCRQGYFMHCKDPMQLGIFDIMHYVNKSAGGLGIPENGVLGCRYHHGLLDNGNKGLRPEMLRRMAEYLKGLYPDWEEESLKFKKYGF